MQERSGYVDDLENGGDSPSPTGTRNALEALDKDTRLKGKGKASSLATFATSPEQSTAFFDSTRTSAGMGLGDGSFEEDSERGLDPEAEAEAARKWQEELALLYAQLKVRDYAFGEDDPRHVGARDVSVSAAQSWDPQVDQYGIADASQAGAADGDEDLFVEGEGSEGGLACGIYQVLYGFQAESEHELTVEAGEKVRVVGGLDGGWAIVETLEPGLPTTTSSTSAEGAQAQEEASTEYRKGLVPESYLGWIEEQAEEQAKS